MPPSSGSTSASGLRARKQGAASKQPSSSSSTSSKATSSSSSSSAPSTRSTFRTLFRLVSFLISLACLAFVAKQHGIDVFKAMVFDDDAIDIVAQDEAVDALFPTDLPTSSSRSPADEGKPPFYVAKPSLPFQIKDPVNITSWGQDDEGREAAPEPFRGADEAKAGAVRFAFETSWKAYVRDAWGYDEYHPLSQSGTNLGGKGKGEGIGYTIVDSIDTLMLMGFKDEYERARDWIKNDLDFRKEGKFNVFETTIRTLGGLLSAHALCTSPSSPPIASAVCSPGDGAMFLSKAEALARRLRPAFRTPTGIPYREVDLSTGEAFSDVDNYGASSLAEATTLQLEFKYLSHLLDQPRWWNLAEKPMRAVRLATEDGPKDGLLPIFIDPETGKFMLSDIRLGSRGDSYYEYLGKQFVQTNRTEFIYRDMYERAMAGVKKHLVKESTMSDPPFIYTAEISPRMIPGYERPTFQLVPKQDHLVCFLGGTLMHGSVYSSSTPHTSVEQPLYPPQSTSSLISRSPSALEDWRLGHEIIRTCVETYSTKTGLAPEIAFFRMQGEKREKMEDWYIKQAPRTRGKPTQPLIDARNILRPETVESLWVAFHLSGDPIYREWGWKIFKAFDVYARVPDIRDPETGTKRRHGAFANVRDVDAHPLEEDVVLEDRMETFWLAETLKYLYLLFSDQSLLRLDEWVMNTEAHPLPIFTPKNPTPWF